MNLAAIVSGIFILVFVVPLMVVLATTGTAGILIALFLGLILLFFVPLFVKTAEQNKRYLEAKRIEENKQQQRMSKLCKNLSRLSSVTVKCPKCQQTFLRVDCLECVIKSGSELHKKYAEKYKSGQLSSDGLREIFTKSIRESGYPSSFKCPKCNEVIIRSREPSGICKVTGERVSGERLLDCTWGKCHMTKN